LKQGVGEFWQATVRRKDQTIVYELKLASGFGFVLRCSSCPDSINRVKQAVHVLADDAESESGPGLLGQA